MLTPALVSNPPMLPRSCSSSAAMRCTGAMNWLSRPRAMDWASARASCNLLVNLSVRTGCYSALGIVSSLDGVEGEEYQSPGAVNGARGIGGNSINPVEMVFEDRG